MRSEVSRKAPPIQRVRVLCMSAPLRLADNRTGERRQASAITASQDAWPLVDLPAVPCPARSRVARRAAVDPATASRFLDS